MISFAVQQLAAEHFKDLLAAADYTRRSREARRARGERPGRKSAVKHPGTCRRRLEQQDRHHHPERGCRRHYQPAAARLSKPVVTGELTRRRVSQSLPDSMSRSLTRPTNWSTDPLDRRERQI
jgi:hypothetical protein